MSDADDETAPAKKSGFATFWTSLPGVLTGVAAVIAAVVSLVALFHHGAETSTSPAAVPSTDSPASPASAPASVPASGLAVSGTMTLAVGEFADLTAGTVSSSRTATSQFYLYGNSGYRLVAAIGQTFAAVDGGPDRQTCVTALSTRQDRQLDLARSLQGKTICVLTDTQQLAALSSTTLPAVGSPRFGFDYVLWE